jgi:hypothetical protein
MKPEEEQPLTERRSIAARVIDASDGNLTRRQIRRPSGGRPDSRPLVAYPAGSTMTVPDIPRWVGTLQKYRKVPAVANVTVTLSSE